MNRFSLNLVTPLRVEGWGNEILLKHAMCEKHAMNSDGIQLAGDLSFHGIPRTEEQSSKDGPHIGVAPVFAQNVSWISAARNVGEVNISCSNCFSQLER